MRSAAGQRTQRGQHMKKLLVGFVMGSMMTGAVALAAGNVSKARHPNLAAAQRLIDQAWEKVSAAQNLLFPPPQADAAHIAFLDTALCGPQAAARAATAPPPATVLTAVR